MQFLIFFFFMTRQQHVSLITTKNIAIRCMYISWLRSYLPLKIMHDSIHNWCTNSHHVWWFEHNAHFDRKVVAFANCRKKLSETSFWNDIQLVVHKMQWQIWNDLSYLDFFWEEKKSSMEQGSVRTNQSKSKEINVLLQRSHLIPLFQKLKHAPFNFFYS